MNQIQRLTPAGRDVAAWLERKVLSKPKACALINEAYRVRTGADGKLDRSMLHRFMVGERTPDVDYAAAIYEVTGTPIQLWSKARPALRAAS